MLKNQIGRTIYCMVLDKSWIFLDRFSFSHLFFGFIVMIVLLQSSYPLALDLIIGFIVLVLWELFEVYAARSKKFYIRLDKLTNSMWDIIIGIFGMIIALIIFIDKIY